MSEELEDIVIEKGVLLFDKQYSHQRTYENTLDRMNLGTRLSYTILMDIK